MPALQVREMPNQLYEQLKARAELEHRSLAQQTIACLEESLNKPLRGVGESGYSPYYVLKFDTEEDRQRRMEKRRQLFERIDKLGGFEVPDDFPSAAELVREDRDSR